jgi:putative Holliday junction resolvase
MLDPRTYPAGTLLAFDFGQKRLGVAVGETLTHHATPLIVLKMKEGVPPWPKVDHLIQIWKPLYLVVGLPTNPDGPVQGITRLVQTFAEELHTRYQLEIAFVDEQFSTEEAKLHFPELRKLGLIKKGPIDHLAAVVILKRWFESFEIV